MPRMQSVEKPDQPAQRQRAVDQTDAEDEPAISDRTTTITETRASCRARSQERNGVDDRVDHLGHLTLHPEAALEQAQPEEDRVAGDEIHGGDTA